MRRLRILEVRPRAEVKRGRGRGESDTASDSEAL